MGCTGPHSGGMPPARRGTGYRVLGLGGLARNHTSARSHLAQLAWTRARSHLAQLAWTRACTPRTAAHGVHSIHTLHGVSSHLHTFTHTLHTTFTPAPGGMLGLEGVLREGGLSRSGAGWRGYRVQARRGSPLTSPFTHHPSHIIRRPPPTAHFTLCPPPTSQVRWRGATARTRTMASMATRRVRMKAVA